MSQEIKFKIWDAENKRMLKMNPLQSVRIFHDGSGYLIDNDDSDTRICDFRPSWSIGEKYNRLLMYIGFTDKNAAMIFNGDIIRVYTTYEPNKEEEIENIFTDHVVQYGDEYDYPAYDLKPSLCPEHNSISDMLCNDEYPYYEIIGNIYETPHLIPEKK